ncbi:MAG: hypothetical protein NZM13_10830 [Cyclobacteriaceae bacterium]|nr:hypothetical protein [Cyclobacteriaceae bacterium]MDW8331879.1 hypothetical protein [Cyclobacteriaceae bacterium]
MLADDVINVFYKIYLSGHPVSRGDNALNHHIKAKLNYLIDLSWLSEVEASLKISKAEASSVFSKTKASVVIT